MYTIEDFKNGRVIIDNETSPNPKKIKKIINSNFRLKASGDGRYYGVDPKNGNWAAKSSIKSFGNLPVQNVNDFQISDSCKTEENEILTQSNVQKLSVGDTYEFGGVYRIISDFKDGMFYVSNRQGIGTGKFSTEELLECFAKSRNYTNYKSVLLTNNKNNQNEKTGKTSTVDRGKRTESSISSSSTRQIASASRLVGDSTHGKCKKTRIGRIEISSNAISF